MRFTKKGLSVLLSILMVLSAVICAIPSASVTAYAQSYDSSASALPAGGHVYNGHYYMLYSWTSGFEAAKTQCETMGGHLLTITSSQENADIYSWFQTSIGNTGARAWMDMIGIGIAADDPSGNASKFFWYTGESTSYTNWCAGDPNDDSGKEGYAGLGWPAGNATWADFSATDPSVSYMICEWEYVCNHTYDVTSVGTRTVYTCTKCGATFWIDTSTKSAFYGSHYYRLRSANQLTWDAANTACQSSGGHLISVGDLAENDLASLLFSTCGRYSAGGTATCALGFHRDSTSSNYLSPYSWSDGSTTTFVGWQNVPSLGYYEPTGPTEYTAKLWSYRSTPSAWCDFAGSDQPYDYICEYDDYTANDYSNLTVTAATCTADGYYTYKNSSNDSITVPRSVTVYSGHKYMYVAKTLAWNAAEAVCESMGGHLAVITSQEEENAIIGLFGQNTAWIGIADFDHQAPIGDYNAAKAYFTWVDGESVSYTDWYATDPNNNAGGQNLPEGYTGMKWSGTNGWADFANGDVNGGTGFVCEWDNADLPGAALGHNYGPYVTTTAPTSTSVGVQTATCANDSTHTLTRPCYYVNFPSGSHYTISDISSNYSELLAADTCTFKLAVDAGYGKNLIVSGSNCTVTGSDGSYSVTSFTGVPTVNVSFEPNNYSVVYDANGGTGAPTAFTATFDQTYYAGVAPTKTGYTFTGWLGSNGNTYQAGDELKDLVTADGGSFSLTAQWSINHYNVRFFNYDGTQIGETQSIEYGSDATAPADPTRLYDKNAHYTFDGWTGYTNITAAKDITATFTFVPHNYTYAVKIAPTADAEGLLAGTCTCGKTVTVDIPVLNDTDYTVTTTAATPDAAGNTHYVWNDNDTYGVNVTGDIAIPALGYTVSFYQEDGTTLIQKQHADTLTDAVAAYDGAVQTKAATAQYTYTFDKWTTSAVDEAAGTYKAVPTFTSTVNKYTVTFKNYDGTVIDTQSIDYGSDATAPADPTKSSDDTDHYTFDGWMGYTNITKNTDITATFTATAHSYTYAVTTEPTKTAAGLLTGTCVCGHTTTVTLPSLNDTDYELVTVAATTDAAGSETYTWRSNAEYGVNVTVVIVIPKTGFTVSFYDESGVTLLDTKTAATLDDALAAYAGETQTKAETSQYTYTFAGWTTTATDVNNGLYNAVAKFDETTRKYTVTFKNDDGTVLDTQSVAYGTAASAPTDPTKAKTAQYSYTFAGWDKTFDNITGDLTVTATYSQTVNTYTVTYYNNDGTVLYTAQVPYGSSITYAGSAPAYVGENAADMEFVGWSVTTDSITGQTTVKAVYKDNGSVISRFFNKLVALIVKIRELLLRITKAHGDTYDVNIWTGGKWQ